MEYIKQFKYEIIFYFVLLSILAKFVIINILILYFIWEFWLQLTNLVKRLEVILYHRLGIKILSQKFLFANISSGGLHFRKNDKRYLGNPDIVLLKYNTIVFIHGCFWHFHDGASML